MHSLPAKMRRSLVVADLCRENKGGVSAEREVGYRLCLHQRKGAAPIINGSIELDGHSTGTISPE